MRHDAAIALLASIFEDVNIDRLVETLESTDGNVELAIERLVQRPTPNKRSRQSPVNKPVPSSKSLSPDNTKKAKLMTMDAWLCDGSKATSLSSVGSSHDVNHQVPSSRLLYRSPISEDTNRSKISSHPPRSLTDVLGESSDMASAGPSKQSKNLLSLPPLHLATPRDVSNQLPCCSLFYNVLPKELATRLYLNMISDCQGQGQDNLPWTRNRWWLNDREVESPHSTAFFVSNLQGKADDYAVDYAESAQYWYAGKALKADAKPRYFLAEMEEAKGIIEPMVNKLLRNDLDMLKMAQRVTPLNPVQRFSSEWDGDWKANVAASNCYRGSKESVGWHADQLTYLGPYPTIASLSLGTGRQFRLRAVRNMNDPNAATPRTYSIFLPHNSLLIMHGSCQERYKHCIPTQNTLDVFKPSTTNAGSHIERINITFRFYRPDFRPTRTINTPNELHPTMLMGTPKCHCGIPTILRADQKGWTSKSRQRLRLFSPHEYSTRGSRTLLGS
ncbi:hypothetical protein CROQUDRAFT_661764 [Cronartium quercuum f. sp. fusiforme G11]|uniref:Fe2OG dioxygenase domain-containing protein n=1 Tax=Cronartium quercuum f. sp. fusiforme G11 TaxID=708437 RepID=A0A9P6T8E5_9BASI|nr:hypothetical protein CROQUDRAFT_661764 [Cronartium quercuum f. sp. fusiforme G11]